MQSPRTLARMAGLVYLMVAVAAGVAGYVRSTIVVAGDAATTAANIRASETLFRAWLLVKGVRMPDRDTPAHAGEGRLIGRRNAEAA